MLCLDLMLMVRYPFQKKESRMTKYMIYSVLVSALQVTFTMYSESQVWIWRVGIVMGFSMLVGYIVTFFISVVYTCQKLSGPGFSKEVRRLILKRHILTSLFYLISNAYVFLSITYMTFADQAKLYNFVAITDNALLNTLKILFAAQGFMIPILRLSEPYFYQILVKKFRMWLCTTRSKTKVNE